MTRAVLLTPPLLGPIGLAELKAFLRLDHDGEDALLAGLLRTAASMAEDFTGVVLLQSVWREHFSARPADYLRLSRSPVRAISAVRLLPATGMATLLEPGTFTVLWGDTREAVLDLQRPVAPDTLIEVDYVAGLASDITQLPDGLRHGIVRLVAHLFMHRDDPAVVGLPAAVAALWQPFRTMRLA